MQHSTVTTHNMVLEKVEQLAPHELCLLQILAMAGEAIPDKTLFDIYRKVGFPVLGATVASTVQALEPALRRLKKLKLIKNKNLLYENLQEMIVRQIFADKETKITRSSRKPVQISLPSKGAKNRPVQQPLPAQSSLAIALIETLRANLPVPSSIYFVSKAQLPSTYARAVRELRIALYQGNDALLDTHYKNACILGDNLEIRGNPLVRIVNTPFDAAWFDTLAPKWRARILSLSLTETFYNLEAYEAALIYALRPDWHSEIPFEDITPFFIHLIVRLMLGGEIQQAHVFVEKLRQLDEQHFSIGMYACLLLLEGHLDEALVSFDTDLKELRRRFHKRTFFFSGFAAPFYILALLWKGDADSLKKAGIYLEQYRQRCEHVILMTPVIAALGAMLESQKGFSQEITGRTLERYRETWNTMEASLGSLFLGMALVAINGQLTAEEIDCLRKNFTQTLKAGLNWLAFENASLLCQVGQETPEYRDFISNMCKTAGITALTGRLKVEEPWRKSLRALQVAADGTQQAQGKKTTGVAESRIIYLLDFSKDGALREVSPMEQKLSAKGVWSKGRPIALRRLASGEKLEGLTEADQALRTAVQRVDYYGNYQYDFNYKKLLPALAGHPLLFLADSPSTSVEVLRSEPEILVMRKGKNIVIRFNPEVSTDEKYLLARETPTRYRLIELSDAHHRLARILGDEGLTLPASAREEITPVLATVASLVTVHSTIPGTAYSVETTPADSMPLVHLLPQGEGFRLEFFVRPFKEGGPYLKPGQGGKTLMADVAGRRYQTERDLSQEKTRAASLERSLPALAGMSEMDGQWFLEHPEDALQVLLELQEAQERGETVVEWPEGERLKVGKQVSFSNVQLRIRDTGNWFEVAGALRINDEQVIEMKQVIDLLQTTSHRFLPLGEGQYVALSKELRKRLDEMCSYLDKRGKKVGIHPLAALALEDFTSQVGQLDADTQWHARLARIREELAQTPVLPSTLKAQLRDYQIEGFCWLIRLAHLGFGACLADDMGLGKTVQTLAAILHNAPHGPTLVVAPTSVCANWIDEAKRFAPTLTTHFFGGSNREALVAELGPFDVLVASYGLLHQEAHLLTAVEWQTVVLDEAQAIKNASTKRSQAAMHLKAKFKVATTGTPIENHLGEFWTLFNFINPGLFGSRERFNTRFAIPIERNNDREARRRLKKLVQPFILRRLKSQVLEELPPRTEVLLQVELSTEESAFYEALRQKALERIDAEQGPAAQKPMQILAEITRLRQACCHPRLVLPQSTLESSKLSLFGEVLNELLENGHKALVFSQFVSHLALIREYLDARAISYRYLDGSTPPKERQSEVAAFQSGEGDLFLISLKAGGLGLNLTAADYVIHMDPWWNPAVEDQASDRAHRIGQDRPVTVYRLVTKNTIEEKIVRLHAEKRDLADSLLDATDVSAKVSAEDLLRLIREP